MDFTKEIKELYQKIKDERDTYEYHKEGVAKMREEFEKARTEDFAKTNDHVWTSHASALYARYEKAKDGLSPLLGTLESKMTMCQLLIQWWNADINERRLQHEMFIPDTSKGFQDAKREFSSLT